ncbi:Metallo-dependent phosphatase-like protein [Umbelopsis sp. AD052]|nr:Metallo-dependent phosphatase-like protein [Umbelopsis sp. AD052]
MYMQNSDPAQFCHRKSASASDNTAGKYGALGTACDSPIPLVQSVFEYLKKAEFQNVDFIIYTGDTARHVRDMEQSRTYSELLEEHRYVMNSFGATFNLQTTKLFPTIGNLDTPVHDNIDLASNDNTSGGIFMELKRLWDPLGLNLTESFSNGGMFVHTILNGPTIVSINSMYFFSKNKQIPDCNEIGSAGAVEMNWLETQLASAAASRRSVYIIAHVPPIKNTKQLYKPQCYAAYVNLLGKYSNIIAAHLTGHTNEDHLAVLHNTTGSFALQGISKLSDMTFSINQISNVLTNSPSIIPVNNPGFRIYKYDTTDGTLLGWDQYWTNLQQDNVQGNVIWSKEYSSSALYGVNRLDKAGWQQLMQRLLTNKKTFSMYKTYINVQYQASNDGEEDD